MGKLIKKKILPLYYEEVRMKRKTFELRTDDSDYQVGDILVLEEWDGENYTGRSLCREITYILRDAEEYGLKKGFCILAIQEERRVNLTRTDREPGEVRYRVEIE